jgi:DNA-directed RNA polymerase specialized sigma24 family protein
MLTSASEPEHQDVEDVVQEAYLRAFRYFEGFHGEPGKG